MARNCSSARAQQTQTETAGTTESSPPGTRTLAGLVDHMLLSNTVRGMLSYSEAQLSLGLVAAEIVKLPDHERALANRYLKILDDFVRGVLYPIMSLPKTDNNNNVDRVFDHYDKLLKHVLRCLKKSVC